MELGRGVSFLLDELVLHEGPSLAGVMLFSLSAHLRIPRRRGCCAYFVNPHGLTLVVGSLRPPTPHLSRRRNRESMDILRETTPEIDLAAWLTGFMQSLLIRLAPPGKGSPTVPVEA